LQIQALVRGCAAEGGCMTLGEELEAEQTALAQCHARAAE